MNISVVDLYRDFLPKTNCKDCGKPTCFAFATQVVVEKYDISKCPHLDESTLSELRKTLKKQYESGKWVKKDPAKDAFEWAKSRAASMKLEDLPQRIGGKFTDDDVRSLELPYFNTTVVITEDDIKILNGAALTTYEKVFIYNHIAQGGSHLPLGIWKGFEEFPNTISKMKSMDDHVEKPIVEKFGGKAHELKIAAEKIEGRDITDEIDSSDLALEFLPLPKVPIRLIFRDAIEDEGIDATVKLLFDVTVPEHLDVESIMFLSERLRQLLCGDEE